MFRYSLRTLVILTAIGPPLLGTIWTQREFLSELVDIATAPGPRIARRIPARRPSVAESKGITDNPELHFVSGAWTVGLYPVAVLALAAVFFTNRDWRRPPKKSPLLAVAALLCVLTAVACTVFFASGPTPIDRSAYSTRTEP